VENPPDPGTSEPEPSSSESTEQSSSTSGHHIPRKILVAGGSIVSAIAIGAGTPLVVKVVDRYFLTPDQQVTTSSPAPPPQGTEPANGNPCLPGDIWDPGRSLCYPPPPGQAVPKTRASPTSTGIPQGVCAIPARLTHRRPIPATIPATNSSGMTSPPTSACSCLKISARREQSVN
jgi:hypothetical protein